MLDKDTIKGFVGSLLAKKFDGATLIPKVHEEWWELCCSDSQHIAIAAPRGHAKSTSITFSYILAAALFRQYSYIMIVSDSESQASLFLGDLKNELIENEDIISLFGVKKFIKLSETDIIVEMEDKHQFRIIAKGAEQKLRGLKWSNKRPDLIVCDDLEGDEAVLNKERREKFKNWFYGALVPAKSQNGKIVVVGTILHMDSLLERLMPKEHELSSVVDGLRIYSKRVGMWRSVKYRAHNEDFSKILWAERFSADNLKNIRQEYADQGIPDVYAREYLNYPIDESTAYFKRTDFLPLSDDDMEELNSNRVKYYTAADFAVSTVQRSDYTVIMTVAVKSTGDLLVVDLRRGRWDSSEVVDEMFSVQKRYKPELFTVEKGVINSSLMPFLNKEMVSRGIYLNLNPMTPSKDKMTRARGIQARLRAGGIRFDKDKYWYHGLEDEMARFPKDRHDDQVDALSWIGLTLDKISEAPTAKEVEEEEYEEMVSDNMLYSGRNAITGY